MGYGAMQLAGRDGNKLVWRPSRDIDGVIALLREAGASGMNHIERPIFMVTMSRTGHTRPYLPIPTI
ncbi:MAG TPA: hypothetical protein VH079_07810 [Terriglobales bacterium]|jgi:hypothetical protein|nr:hypothetical protein [Terriglobales bacterium]